MERQIEYIMSSRLKSKEPLGVVNEQARLDGMLQLFCKYKIEYPAYLDDWNALEAEVMAVDREKTNVKERLDQITERSLSVIYLILDNPNKV